ncbi:MAG: phosphotransferase [Acidimicrobiales bacterium]
MAALDLSIVPEERRNLVHAVVDAAFGTTAHAIAAVAGGWSGALTYRVDASDGPFLIRVEMIRGFVRNPYQYDCMRIAAEAGIAPPIRHLDADAGVVVMPFLTARPLSDHPGGPLGVARDAGALLARLHQTVPFRAHGDYLTNLTTMVQFLEGSGRVAPGLLQPHRAGFERIRAAYPWQPERFVSSHNDPNEQNLLFDGRRLWLVDWETASRSDPFIDAAIMASYLAPTNDLRHVLLSAWLGRPPDRLDQARLALMARITQLYVGCVLLLIAVDPATPRHTDLAAMDLDELRATFARGDLVGGTAVGSIAFAKTMLQMFLDSLTTPDLDESLRVIALG